MRKLKIGKRIFKGKLPLICFSCGEVQNFIEKGTFSLKKIAHHPMKTVTVKKKPMREYCLWPSTINKMYQTMKKNGLP